MALAVAMETGDDGGGLWRREVWGCEACWNDEKIRKGLMYDAKKTYFVLFFTHHLARQHSFNLCQGKVVIKCSKKRKILTFPSLNLPLGVARWLVRPVRVYCACKSSLNPIPLHVRAKTSSKSRQANICTSFCSFITRPFDCYDFSRHFVSLINYFPQNQHEFGQFFSYSFHFSPPLSDLR